MKPFAAAFSDKRTWQESFEALKKYKAKHGDCLVPIHNYRDDPALGGKPQGRCR